MINAYLNNKDSGVLKWVDVVTVIFSMSECKEVSKLAPVAMAFENVSRPNHFRINVSMLTDIIESEVMTVDSLEKAGFVQGKDFLHDDSTRLTFRTMRRLLFSVSDGMEAYEFIEQIFHLYRVYERTQTSNPIYWTAYVRTSLPPKNAQPHLSKTKPMDNQPTIVGFVKGSVRAIKNRIARYQMDGALDSEQSFPIYESMLMNAIDEISVIMDELERRIAMPFRMAQLKTIDANGNEIKKVHQTKANVIVRRSMILIDVDQEDFTVKSLTEFIETIRDEIRLGKCHLDEDDFMARDNFTSPRLFNESNGMFLDKNKTFLVKSISLDQHTLATSIASSSLKTVKSDGAIIKLGTTPRSRSTTDPLEKRKVSRERASTTDSFVSTASSFDNDESDSDSDDEERPRRPGRTRSYSNVARRESISVEPNAPLHNLEEVSSESDH